MCIATGLGAVPFFFIKSPSKALSGICNAMACGVMIAASFDLIHEGQVYDGFTTVIGLLLGVGFTYIMQKKFSNSSNIKFSDLTGLNAKKAIMIVGIMAVHSVGEGAGVGVSFAGGNGWTKGALITFAIAVHNIPEGLAVALVLVSRGVSTFKAMLWATFTSIPQPLLAVPAFVFVDTFRSLLPLALGFAAGCMIYVVFAELIPDAYEDISSRSMAIWTTVSAAILELLRIGIDAFAEKGMKIIINPDDDMIYDWLVTKAYVLIIAVIASCVSSLLVRILKSSIAAVNVIKILIMVFAGSFALATIQREFSACALFYRRTPLSSRLWYTITGGITAIFLTKFLPIKEDGLPQLSNDTGSPTKKRKTLNTSMVVPIYTTASLAAWTFALGLSTDAIGIRYRYQVPFDVLKVTLAILFATIALSSNRSSFVSSYMGGVIVSSAMFLGVCLHDFTLYDFTIMKKGTHLNVEMHSFSVGMQYVFMGAAIREIITKRAFGHASVKYWTFVLGAILAAMLCAISLISTQKLLVETQSIYNLSFC